MLVYGVDCFAAYVLAQGKSVCAVLFFGFYFLSLQNVKSQPQNPRFWLVVNIFLAVVICFAYFSTYFGRYHYSNLGHALDLIGLLAFLIYARVMGSTPQGGRSINSKDLGSS